MKNVAPCTLTLCCLAITLSAPPGCGSRLIRLGDQSVDVSAEGGNAGVGNGAAAAGGETVAGSSADGGAAGNDDPCPHAQVQGSEVLWIGDSWIQRPGTQHTRVRDFARAAGAIAPTDDYVDLAVDAASMAQVAKQYETRQSGATKVKVLLMDGGTWDPIAAQMAGTSISAAIDNSINTFQRFLAQVASDGTVEHIVYFLVPELPTIPGVSSMRPRLQQACADSSVPCHFIDLQPYWLGHPELTDASGIQSSDAGAVVISNLIWNTMQDNCIAQ